MEIYRVRTRLTMVMDVADDFSFDRKAEADAGTSACRRVPLDRPGPRGYLK